MSQVPEIVADLSSRLFEEVHRIEIELDRIRRKDERGDVDLIDHGFLCEVQRKIIDLGRRERSL